MSTSWVPQSCTLPTAERPVRVAEFDELLGTAILDASRPAPDRLRLRLTPTPEVAARVAELAARETACCSFFTFGLTLVDGSTTLDITVPSPHVEVLDALAARLHRTA